MGAGDEWERVDNYVKQRNLVIPNLFGDSEHLHKIPLPYGFSTFFNLGRLSAAYGRGAQTGAEVFSGVLSEVGQSWSPVGGLSALTIIPSVLKPAYEVYTNENTFFGGQIVFEDSNRGPLSHQGTGTESWAAQHGRQHPERQPQAPDPPASWQGLPREIQQAYEADLDLMKLGGMSV
jgi:hypothetical protein